MTATSPLTLTTTVDSPVGPLTLTAVDDRLTGLHMVDQAYAPVPRTERTEDPNAFAEVTGQLAAYFDGDLTEFDLPLQMAGTDFQRRVWEVLRQIPFGETWSYSQVAGKVGNDRACRAVGLANGRNPIGIIVPCHRVIGANGTLTGYGGGLDRKAWLLDHERRVSADRASLSS
jgi:methylated-DNA-[protein]-cysteine S-methyltransferase